MTRSTARRVEDQGRLFWAWLLTFPIVALHAASWAFGAPWPSRLRLNLALVGLAFPVIFVVGEPLFRGAREARRNGGFGTIVWFAIAVGFAYVAGVIAVFVPLASLAGISAIVVSTYLTVRYLLEWD